MNEVVGGRDTREGVLQAVGLEDVSVHNLGLVVRPSRQCLWSAEHAAHLPP